MLGLAHHDKIVNDKIIISTREAGNSFELINSFKNLGVRVIEFPMIQILPVNLSKSEKDIFKQLTNFQWIIFTSANGVKYFFEFFKKVHNSSKITDTINIAAIGMKTANKLLEYNCNPHFIGQGIDSESFSKELKILFQDKNPRILFPTSNLSRDKMENSLKEYAQVKRLNLYNTDKPEFVDQEIIKIITGDHYELIFFFSPSAINNFCDIISGQIDLKRIRAACIGNTTKNTCVKKGITPIFTPQKPDTKNLVMATIEYLNNR